MWQYLEKVQLEVGYEFEFVPTRKIIKCTFKLKHEDTSFLTENASISSVNRVQSHV